MILKFHRNYFEKLEKGQKHIEPTDMLVMVRYSTKQMKLPRYL